jgi:GT2 family glycosyltransferase
MIAVIIVDYNSEKFLRRCLCSLVALGRKDLNFIVVDNGGSLDSPSLEAAFPRLTVLDPETNLGFAGGCNAGMQRAIQDGADYCLLLNPDTVASEDFLEPLLSLMKDDDRVGIACPTVCDDDEVGEVAYGGGGINWCTGRAYVIRGRRLQGDGPSVAVPFATGSAMMLRSSAVRDVGLMDEGYFLYFEDVEYSQMFLRAGWKVVYVREAEIRHAASSITGFQSERYVYYFARNRIRFMRRCGRWHHRFVFYGFNTLVRLPGAMIVFGLLRGRPELAMAFFRGWLDGMSRR